MSEERVIEEEPMLILSHLELPADVRNLEEVTLCPFARHRLANMSENSSRQPKKDIYEIGLQFLDEDQIKIRLVYGDSEESRRECSLEFIVQHGKTKLKYRQTDINHNLQMWSVTTREDFFQLFTQHFNVLARLYQDEIKVLTVHSYITREFDLGFTSLKKLEKLVIMSQFDVVSMHIPLVEHPLKQIGVHGRSEMNDLEHMVLNAEDIVFLPHISMTNEQFLRLSADFVVMKIGGTEMNELDVFNYINCWRDGSNKKEKSVVLFIWNDEEFRPELVFRQLGIEITSYNNIVEEIAHRKEEGKYASLTVTNTHFVIKFHKKQELGAQQSSYLDNLESIFNLLRL